VEKKGRKLQSGWLYRLVRFHHHRLSLSPLNSALAFSVSRARSAERRMRFSEQVIRGFDFSPGRADCFLSRRIWPSFLLFPRAAEEMTNKRVSQAGPRSTVAMAMLAPRYRRSTLHKVTRDGKKSRPRAPRAPVSSGSNFFSSGPFALLLAGRSGISGPMICEERARAEVATILATVQARNFSGARWSD
jgi:hypothetical protein